MNHVQQRIFYAGARDTRVLAARRTGKTDGVIGPHVGAVVENLPGATCGWLGSARSQLYSRTVPGTIAAIERFYGLVEGIHFGWGRPPKHVQKSLVRPKSYDNIIWFANGTQFALISLAIFGSANSYTFSHLIADECKFLSKTKIDGEVMPALSGNVHPLGDTRFSEINPYYRGTMFCSDASLSTKGNWLEKEEEQMDDRIELGPMAGRTYREVQTELVDYAEKVIRYNSLMYDAKKEGRKVMVVDADTKDRILALAQAVKSREGQFRIIPYKEITKPTCEMLVSYHLASVEDAELLYNYRYLITKDEHFEIMMIQRSRKYADRIRSLRCSARCFFRANTLDNVDILGEEYIARMKRDLSPIVFQISVMNAKVRKSNDGFYSNLDIENIHGYIPDDCPAIDSSIKTRKAEGVIGSNCVKAEYESPDFAALQATKDCTLDGDVVDSLALHIAMDTNANINWFVTGQMYRRDGVEALNVLSSMFVKNERKLKELCYDWNRYYAPHRRHCRTVYFYYDATAKFRGYAIEGMQDFKDVVIDELRRYGWDVVGIDMGAPMAHEMKYKDINEALAGVSYPAIRINRLNNESLIIALQTAEVQIGYKGFRKDKSGEKLSEDAQKDDVVRLELRTDGTDAFDNLFIGVKYHRNRLLGMCMPGVSRR